MTVELHDIDAVVDPATGEILHLADASVRELAMFLEHTKALENAQREQKAAVSVEFHRRMDAGAKWTLKDEEFVVVGRSPDRVTYSEAKLYELLEHLVAEDLIAPAAADAAVERTYVYTAKSAGINALKKLGGAVATAVESCAVPVDPFTRRVSVKRKGYVE